MSLLCCVGLMAGLPGFARDRELSPSRGWLPIVEAPTVDVSQAPNLHSVVNCSSCHELFLHSSSTCSRR